MESYPNILNTCTSPHLQQHIEPALEAARRNSLIFGLFRVVPVFFSVNGSDGDRGDEGRVAVHVGVAFGQDVDGGEVIFAELVGQQAEPPAQQKDLSERLA